MKPQCKANDHIEIKLAEDNSGLYFFDTKTTETAAFVLGKSNDAINEFVNRHFVPTSELFECFIKTELAETWLRSHNFITYKKNSSDS